MGVYDLLVEYGEFSCAHTFNGLLSDYLKEKEDSFNDIWQQLVDINPEVRIYAGYKININFDLISNKKIGYRDISKVPEGKCKVPYIIYWQQEDTQRAILVNTHNFIEARGMYYCLTEPGSSFEAVRGEMICYYLDANRSNEIIECYKNLANKENSVGYIQKKYEFEACRDEEVMKENCVRIAKELFADTIEQVKTLEKEEKAELIYQTVARVFLMKKALYVRYMTNRKLLADRHGGDVVCQRKFAKCYVDEIEIVPYYQLWNGDKKEEDLTE